MVSAAAGGASLERAALEGFWEEVAFQRGLHGGEGSCPAKASGRNGPRGSNCEGKGWQAEA